MPSESQAEPENKVEAFGRKHRTGLVTLLFTDMVGSTAVKQQLGDRSGAIFFDRHHELVRQTLEAFTGGQEIETAGDSFLITFSTPSDAVQFALLLQARLRQLSQESAVSARDRIGIHVGEVVIKGDEASAKPKDLYGIQIDTCSRVMSLAKAGQVLMTRAVFDSARQVLKGEDIQGVGHLEWLNHGPYLLKGLEEPAEICEVREQGQPDAGPPTSSEKAQRQVGADQEPVLGWRPAVSQVIPNTRWILEKKLGEGGFGEVWLGRNSTTKERRVFKFCFQAERVRFLKRELTLFRLLRERGGDHPNIVAIRDVYLDKPPFYVEMDYVEGADLRSWCEQHGGVEAIPLETRLEIVAQAADGLQAAHDAGIIHRDIKPANILIAERGGVRNAELNPKPEFFSAKPEVKLTDFGIGQVVSEEYLKGITRAGFTQTLMADSSSSRTGTQLYMAPELLAGKPASIRSDIYSLGVVLYQLLVRDLSRPVTTDWAADIEDRLLLEDLQHCFAGKPEERFAGVGLLARNVRQLSQRRAEVARQLNEQAARERAAYRRGMLRTTALAIVIVLLVCALALLALLQSRKARDAAARANAGELLARKNLYAADMLLAHQALEANNRGRAVQLLERNRPRDGIDARGWEWRYLWTLCRSDALSLSPAHSDRVTDVTFSTDGELLFSASMDATIKVWEVATRSVRRTVPQPFPVRAMALSADGQWLVAGALDRLIFWNTRTWSNESLTIPAGGVLDLVFSPAGDRLAIRRGSQIEVIRWHDHAVVATLPASSYARNGQSMAFSADGEVLAYPAPEGKVALAELNSNTPVRLLPGVMDDVNSIALSADGRFLAAADWSPRIAVWELASSMEARSLTNHAAWVSSVAFLPNGTELISASADQTVKLWDTRNWQEVATRRGHLDEVHCLAISPRGDWLATGGKDGAVNLWSTRPTPKEASHLEFRAGGGTLSLDGGTLLVSDEDGTVVRWDAVALEPRATNKLRGGDTVLSLGVKRLAVGRPDGGVEVRESITLDRLTELKAPPGRPSRLRFSMDDSFLAVSSGQDVSLWDARDGHQTTRIDALPSGVSSLEFSPDNKLLAVALADGRVQVWRLNATGLLRTLVGQREPSGSGGMAFSPDGRFLATGSPDATLRLWDLETGSFVPLPRALMAYFSVAYSPDGKRIAAAGPDPVVKIIDTTTGEEAASLDRNTRYRDFARFVRFSRDGNALLVLTTTSLSVWHTASLAEIQATEEAQATVHQTR
jgi:WD40 repeat protein/serine/threonine protein kinase/class 3 adenylate cyclase